MSFTGAPSRSVFQQSSDRVLKQDPTGDPARRVPQQSSDRVLKQDPPERFDKSGLRERLTPLQYRVTQEHNTERAFSGRYNKHFDSGVYGCVVCGTDVFSSATKYDSGSGWPSFYDVLDTSRVRLKADLSHVGSLLVLIANPELERTSVSCARCGSHLGHVFSDGPKPTGKRYCVNSESLLFRADSSVDSAVDSAARVGVFRGACALRGSCAQAPAPLRGSCDQAPAPLRGSCAQAPAPLRRPCALVPAPLQGSCAQAPAPLQGSCAQTPAPLRARSPGTAAAIARVVDKYNALDRGVEERVHVTSSRPL